MSQPFMGEIKIISWNFPPKGWAFCNGQLLPINQNQALFSILGTTYGGDGRVNFALPDFRDRVPFHVGNGHILGERGGEESHTLNAGEMPAHLHQVTGSNATTLLQVGPANNVWSTSTQSPFETSQNNAMNPGTIANVGGSQAHNNLQPYLVLNFIIALQGIFPSQN
jgi:microcystin-dependent protein